MLATVYPAITPWAWPLTEVERLTPYVAVRGQRGFWPWTHYQREAA